MFDSVDAERLARRMHPPAVIWVMLVIAILAAAVIAGHSMANQTTRNWLYRIAIGATISVVVFVIIELEFPRLGSIRMSGADSALYELRATMQAVAQTQPDVGH
jgi:hypothetical protein